MSRNLTLRLLSAAVLIPVVFGAIYAGGWIFAAFIALAFMLCGWEWSVLTRTLKPRLIYILTGIVYFAVSFYLFVVLRTQYESGLYLVFTLMLCVWASDTVAYIFGRLLKGPKMSPTISPNKTWSGLLGAVVGSGMTFALLGTYAHALTGIVPNTIPAAVAPFPVLVLCGAVLGYVGQAGDLLESLMKRKAGVKDSGNLIPGHGGILDRVDSLLLIVPVFVAICRLGL